MLRCLKDVICIIDFGWIRKNRYKTLLDASKQLFIYVDGISKVQRVVEINMCTLLIDMIRCAHGQCTDNRPSGQSSPAESSVNSSYIVWRRSPVYKYIDTIHDLWRVYVRTWTSKRNQHSIYTMEVSQESEERRTTHEGILRTVCELLGSDIPKKSVGRSVMLNIICPLVVHILC